uniref:Uncharacterized protein n=1 Tax=Sphingomonas sp. NS2 TaxID=908605 RepID=A0A0D4ZZI1_9SPHN|nr:hypothetical protein plasmid201_158 [Sphingomonas sp. NS2]
MVFPRAQQHGLSASSHHHWQNGMGVTSSDHQNNAANKD